MDCRIVDCKVVRDGSLVSVAPNHFGQADRSDCYFGRVVRVVHDASAQIKWFEDDTISIKLLDVLQLQVEISEKKKPKFQMCIKASSSCGNDVEFDMGDTTLIVDDNQNPEQENLTTIHDGTTPVDSSTPAGEYVQLAFNIHKKVH